MRFENWPKFYLLGIHTVGVIPPSYDVFEEKTVDESYHLGKTFEERADFIGAIFKEDAEFIGVTFEEEAYFIGATFESMSEIGGNFGKEVYFIEATFEERASFTPSTFEKEAHFINSTFEQEASFMGVTFEGRANFTDATFKQIPTFEGATFNTPPDFQGTGFAPQDGTTQEESIPEWIEKLDLISSITGLSFLELLRRSDHSIEDVRAAISEASTKGIQITDNLSEEARNFVEASVSDSESNENHMDEEEKED